MQFVIRKLPLVPKSLVKSTPAATLEKVEVPMSTFCFFLLCAAAFAQSATWDSLLSDADQLQKKGSYADAQKRLEDALTQAELFGPRDTRLAITLNNLGIVLRIQGKYE